MEKRLVLAIILSILVLIAFQYIFVRPQKPLPAQPETTAAAAETPRAPAGTASEPTQKAAARAVAPPAAPALKPIEAEKEESVTIKTDLYRAAWTTKGAVLTSWTLTKYKGDAKKD